MQLIGSLIRGFYNVDFLEKKKKKENNAKHNHAVNGIVKYLLPIIFVKVNLLGFNVSEIKMKSGVLLSSNLTSVIDRSNLIGRWHEVNY